MNEKRLQELVEKNINLSVYDELGLMEIWDEMLSILSKNLNETIAYLDSASAKDIYHISSVYDDLSEVFKSEELIECMKRNAIRTGVDCAVDIEYAIIAMNDSDN